MGGIMFLFCIFVEEKPVEIRNIRQAVGLDFSMKELYVDSNGKHAGYPHYFRETARKTGESAEKTEPLPEGKQSL